MEAEPSAVQTAHGGGPTDTVSLSAATYDFGLTFVGSPLTRAVVTVTNTGGSSVTLNPVVTGDRSFEVAKGGCAHSLQQGASCTVLVEYLPSIAAPSGETAMLTLGIETLVRGAVQSVQLRGESTRLAPGQVTQTANSLVAQYTLTLPGPASWVVHFKRLNEPGRRTSAQTTTAAGTSSVYVAGMLPNTTYRMHAKVILANGATATDQAQTFTTGALPPGIPPTIAVKRNDSLPAQPGIELINTVGGAILRTAFATDLDGNVIWTYPFPDLAGPVVLYPVTLLPNGHFLGMIARNSAEGTPPPTELNVIREFDLAGNTVQQLSMTDLNARLAANGFNLSLSVFSHDIVLLPNGHYLVIANTFKAYTDLPGYPGTTQVLGDVVVDLDSSLQPRWVWNSFDHLDVNRHPMSFPDWTHANSLAYSKDDGNLLISLRHQNWVLKVDYQNGAGTGNILWRLGQGGDFTLQGGTDPTDWFYAQHYAHFTSPNTTGVFSLELFDNGDDRMFPSGTTCGPLPQQTPCLYSTVIEMRVNESAKTARFLFHDILPPQYYSAFAGNAELLHNGDFEYNLAGVGSSAYIFEVDPRQELGEPPKTVWEMDMPGTITYRAMRVPSLYPGVQW